MHAGRQFFLSPASIQVANRKWRFVVSPVSNACAISAHIVALGIRNWDRGRVARLRGQMAPAAAREKALSPFMDTLKTFRATRDVTRVNHAPLDRAPCPLALANFMFPFRWKRAPGRRL